MSEKVREGGKEGMKEGGVSEHVKRESKSAMGRGSERAVRE